jgi:UDP-N-acetylglucosamine diphosphorylase/glucosamine-1-phosphate N-acetyltransferase
MRDVSTCSAIVLAAGKGTRMRSDIAKVLHPFRGDPLVLHPVRAAARAGADPIVVVVGHDGARVEATVRAATDGASYLRFAEQAQQLGTGHAVSCALAHLADFEGPVLVLSGDVPLVRTATLRGLVDACRRASAGLALGVFSPEDPSGYGRILRGADGAVVGIREHRDASPEERAIGECNAGLYCVDARRLRDVLPTVRRDNAQGEIYLTDIVAPLASTGEVIAVPLDPLEAAGVNSPEELARLEALAPNA